MNEFGVPVGYVWILAAVAGSLFGFVAGRDGRSIAGYAITAFLTTLTIAGILFGLAHAITVPYTSGQGTRLGIYATVATLVVVLASATLAWRFSKAGVK